MTEPVAQAAADTVKSLVQNAERLGLTWSLRLATIDAPIDAGNAVGTYDGDAEPLGMISMIGLTRKGQRVWVIGAPPSGNYIVGAAGESTTMYRQTVLASVASASLIFTDIPSDLSSLMITYTARMAAAGADNLKCQVNADATANAHRSVGYGNNGAVYLTPFVLTDTSWFVGLVGGNNNANEYSGGSMTINNWNALHTALGYLNFESASFVFVNGVNAFGRTNGGNYSGIGPYRTLTFTTGAGTSFAAGTKFEMLGWR